MTIESLRSSIRDCVRQDAPLAIVGNPYVDYERLFAFHTITDLVIHNQHRFLATYGSKTSDFFIDKKILSRTRYQYLL
jgi:hypothetical protein